MIALSAIATDTSFRCTWALRRTSSVEPDSEAGAEILAHYDGDPAYPLVEALRQAPIPVTSVGELAARL